MIKIPTPVGTKYYLTLTREIFSDKSIIGHIYFCPISFKGLSEKEQNPKAYTSLELAWNDNKRSESCIPPGIYPLKYKTYGRFYEKYHSNAKLKHEFVPLVSKVPGRSEILFHIGNYPRNTLGCVLVGEFAGVEKEDYIKNSFNSYNKFYKEMDKKRPQYLVVEQPDYPFDESRLYKSL